jgi:glyoxylase-like metal-dependent hydrolase (beta-lactamase superfamily II)
MATELADGIWWFDLRGVNAYLVEDGDTVTLVDSGIPYDRRRLVVELDQLGYSPGDVDRALVTHYDFDHVGGLGRVTGFDGTVYAGRPDASLIAGERRPDWHSHKGFTQRLTAPLLSLPESPVEPVDDGDTVGSFTVYHTPGHTAGHVCYVSEERSVAFLGDLVRETNGRLEPSPWILSEDTDQVRSSIRRLAAEAPEFAVAAMGHGVPFRENGSQRLQELADRL